MKTPLSFFKFVLLGSLWVVVSPAMADSPKSNGPPQAKTAAKDFTDFGKAWKLRQRWPSPRVEPDSGFRLGGNNSDDTLRQLKSINGIAIGELEKRMRPNAYSPAGFLGPSEHLIEILRKDNAYVVGKKTTHRHLAEALELMEDIGQKASESSEGPVHFKFRGQTYLYQVSINEGFQKNPFSHAKGPEDAADEELTTSGSGMITLKNLSNGQELKWSTMMPFLIQRYGFYEGEGTRFRIPPEKIFALLPFLSDATASR